jgi:hypothetical protein
VSHADPPAASEVARLVPARPGLRSATVESLDAVSSWCHHGEMNELLVGYARASTEHQDLTAQRNSLAALGVGDDRIYVDHGLTGTNRDRPLIPSGQPPKAI